MAGVYPGSGWGGPFVSVSAQNRKKKSALQVKHIGQVPNEYGKLVNISGTASNSLLAFENDKGEVYIFEFRGNLLNPRAFKVDRKY